MAAGGRAWTGWISFAGTMLVVVGMLNVFQGFVTLIWDEQAVAVANKFVLVDLTSWGWTLLLSGVLMIAIGAGLFGGWGWARFAAIGVVILHAGSQIAWLGAYPVWALLMIGLDTVVLFALTARWSQSVDDLTSYGGPAADRMGGGAERFGPEAGAYQTRVR